MDEFVYERKKMNKKLRKTIRLTAISLGALLTVFLLADQRVDANAEEKQGEENSIETATEQQKGGKQ